MSIHDFLERLHAGLLIGRVNGLVDLGLVGWSQGLAQDIEGFDDPEDLGGGAAEDQRRSQLADPRPELLRCPPSG